MTATAPTVAVAASSHTDSPPRILGLDGLRAVAVIAVLLFHTDSSPLAGGYLGVDLFFVLSGFLITGILLAESQRVGRIALGAFWLRRARRLAPALLLLLMVLAAVRLSLAPDLRDAWRADIVAALTYTTNWWEIVQAGDYFAQFGPASPLLHTWSLAIEEQFYLLFAVFMALIARYAVSRRTLLVLLMAGTAVSIATMQWATTTGAVSWAYYATVPRLQALLIGAMLAVLLQGRCSALWARWRPAAGIAGLLGMAILLGGVWPASFGPTYTAFAVCAAGVVWSVAAGGGLSSALSWRPLAMLGLISYGVYLWHWPIFLWLQADDASVPEEAAAWLLTLAVATASYLAVERPIRQGRFTRLAPAKQWVVYGLAALAVLLLVGVPGRGSEQETRLASDDEVAALARPAQPQASNPKRPARQWPADRSVPRRIIAHGDSTVLALAVRFPHDKYPGRDVGGAALLGCGFSPLPYYPAEGVLPPPAQCQAWRETWRGWNARIDAQVAVTAVSAWDAVDRLQDGQRIGVGNLLFDRSFAVALESGVRIASRGGEIPVYVLGMPCNASKKADGQYRNDPVRRQHLNSLAQAVVSRIPNARYVDLTAFTCDEGSSISNDRSKALFLDGVHWSPQGGRAMWSLLLGRWRADGLMRPGRGG